MSRADVELSAMHAIADAMMTLPDGEARIRVLRWAAEHFDADPAPSVLQPEPASAAAESHRGGDPLNLESIFDDGVEPSFITNTPRRRSASLPVTTALHNFVSDFQKLAHDWQNA